METSELTGIALRQLCRGALLQGGLLGPLGCLTDQQRCFEVHNLHRAALARALLALEADLLRVGALEAESVGGPPGGEAATRERLLLEGHGLLRRGFGAVSLEYWAAPRDLITGRAVKEDGERVGTHAGHLSLECASQETPLALGVAVSGNAKPALPLPAGAFLAEPLGGEVRTATCFVLRLEEAVCMSSEAAAELRATLATAAGPTPELPEEEEEEAAAEVVPASSGEGSLQGLLLAAAGAGPGSEPACHTGENGLSQRWLLGGLSHRGVAVSRLPFSRLAALHPALQVLRRQHAFNHLFISCFKTPSETLVPGPNIGALALEFPVSSFELVADPVAMWLQIAAVHPTSRKLLSIRVSVGLGGTVDAEVSVMPGTAPLEGERTLQNVLRVSLDIPLAIDAAFPAVAP